jgi:hypothetical protein
MCSDGAVNMPLLTERKDQEPEGYKHVAPPEPEPRYNEDHFSGKAQLNSKLERFTTQLNKEARLMASLGIAVLQRDPQSLFNPEDPTVGLKLCEPIFGQSF